MDGEIETYTVMVARDGVPDLGIVAILTQEGARVWGTITDTDTLESLTTEEGCGRRCRLRTGPDSRGALGLSVEVR